MSSSGTSSPSASLALLTSARGYGKVPLVKRLGRGVLRRYARPKGQVRVDLLGRVADVRTEPERVGGRGSSLSNDANPSMMSRTAR